jgi:hypothetical protein
MFSKSSAGVFILAVVGFVAAPAAAQSVSTYAISPAGPNDARATFIPPGAAVFVVDNAKGQISLCYPDNQDNKWVVRCSAPTKLP